MNSDFIAIARNFAAEFRTATKLTAWQNLAGVRHVPLGALVPAASRHAHIASHMNETNNKAFVEDLSLRDLPAARREKSKRMNGPKMASSQRTFGIQAKLRTSSKARWSLQRPRIPKTIRLGLWSMRKRPTALDFAKYAIHDLGTHAAPPDDLTRRDCHPLRATPLAVFGRAIRIPPVPWPIPDRRR